MTYETLLVDIRDGVAIVTINRPELRDAVSKQVQADLRAVVERLARASLHTTDDKREGTEALLAKRGPEFTGSRR
jgi:hypothetical protein